MLKERRTIEKKDVGGCSKNEEKYTKKKRSGQKIENIERMHSLNDAILNKLKFYEETSTQSGDNTGI